MMATTKDSGGGGGGGGDSVHECSYRCDSKKHASNLTAAVIKSRLSDEKVAAYLKWCCVKYAQAVDSSGRSLIHVAASKGRLQLLRFLLTHKDANINARDLESSYSPLHSSLYYGQLHCAVRLIQGGASLQQTDLDDLTPLDHVMKDRPSILTYNANQPCEVYIWGINTNYTLGTGHNHSKANPEPLDYFRKENISIKQTLLSKFHSLFIGSNGRVWTCGLGSGGRLGLGDETSALFPKLLKIGSNSEVFRIRTASIGTDHSVLLMENGSVWSFGLNSYHQLGHSPPPEKVLIPKAVKALRGFEIIGVSASKFHTVFWTDNQLFTCGLHGGQLGHPKTNESTISTPKVVTKLDLKSSTIKHAATSDGGTVVVSSKGDVFLFHEYSCKKLTSKTSKLPTKKICMLGGNLDHKVYTGCLQEKGGDELKILILTETDSIYLWQETCPQMIRCLLSLHRLVVITDIALNRLSLLLTTVDGEAFQGEIKVRRKRRKTTLDALDKPPSPKTNVSKFTLKSEEELNYVKLKRIPHVHRAVNVACDLKGRNFAVVQVHPKAGLLEVPLVEASDMKENMKTLLNSAQEFDTLHDVIFEVGGIRFPAHRYVVSHSCQVLERLINNKSEQIDEVYHVKVDGVQPRIFQRILRYLYSGECDLLDLVDGRPLSSEGVVIFERGKEGAKSNENSSDHKEVVVGRDNGCRQQRPHKKKGECKTLVLSKAEDPIRAMRDAARFFELPNLAKALEAKASSVRYDSGCISKTAEEGDCGEEKVVALHHHHHHQQQQQPVFCRKSLPNLWDIHLESENGEVIKAHKCILVARLEYFNCMINQGWLESSLKTPLKLPIPGNVLEILIRFLYTDEAPELMNTDDSDLASHVLVISDQYFCTRLKEIAETSLGNMINLKNAVEMLQLAVTYNANQLKKCSMEFICLNLSAVLESQSLEILDDNLLTELKDFYRSWLPCMRHREIGTPKEAPNDEFIEAIYNAEPVSLEKEVVEEETASSKPNLKTPKKRSQREKKTSESENRRERNSSVGSSNSNSNNYNNNNNTSSDEDLLSSLDYSDGGSKEETWIMVTSHSNKHQRVAANQCKSELSKTSSKTLAFVGALPRSPTVPIQRQSSIVVVPEISPQLRKLRKESFSEADKHFSFLSTSCDKEFPALSASAPEKTSTPITISPKSPSESFKKFVKLSQKQRKRAANQSTKQPPPPAPEEDEETTIQKKSVEVVKSVWRIPKYEEPPPPPPPPPPPLPQSWPNVTKQDIKSADLQNSFALVSSPPWQGPSPSTCSLSAIMAAERQQRDLLSKIKSKPLEYTQMEDKAIDDLMILYDIPNVTDERITVRRAEPILYSPPVWVSGHTHK